jgi:hypothetical protein
MQVSWHQATNKYYVDIDGLAMCDASLHWAAAFLRLESSSRPIARLEPGIVLATSVDDVNHCFWPPKRSCKQKNKDSRAKLMDPLLHLIGMPNSPVISLGSYSMSCPSHFNLGSHVVALFVCCVLCLLVRCRNCVRRL